MAGQGSPEMATAASANFQDSDLDSRSLSVYNDLHIYRFAIVLEP